MNTHIHCATRVFLHKFRLKQDTTSSHTNVTTTVTRLLLQSNTMHPKTCACPASLGTLYPYAAAWKLPRQVLCLQHSELRNVFRLPTHVQTSKASSLLLFMPSTNKKPWLQSLESWSGLRDSARLTKSPSVGLNEPYGFGVVRDVHEGHEDMS